MVGTWLSTLCCAVLLWRQGRGAAHQARLETALQGVLQRLDGIGQGVRDEARGVREEMRGAAASQAQAQALRLADLEASGARQQEQHAAAQLAQLRLTHDTMQTQLGCQLTAHGQSRSEQKVALDGVMAKVAALTEAHTGRQEALRQTIAQGLEGMRKENEHKLEQMRATVEEKLQGTLEKRLGDSFKQVSDRLEQVHKGLGEMQHLATGVGDLKRVLGNVKSRGGWGEVQLGMLLADLLTTEQYRPNARIRPDSSEVVEFAVHLPGRDGDGPLLLPIDAKFPHEDYERLLVAQESGSSEEVERAATALDRALRTEGKRICEKYVHPPHSTDFGIMYLPTEGLFAEVMRRPGLAGELQTKYRVMVTGPTTLAALLSSLQMGFRTLAIEKRSSEVWQILGAAKAEFIRYGDVWEKLGKQLDTAKRTVDEAGTRTRAVTRRLSAVQTLDVHALPAPPTAAAAAAPPAS